jgi:hypothetical protein
MRKLNTHVNIELLFLSEMQFVARWRSQRVLQSSEGNNHALTRYLYYFLHDSTMKKAERFEMILTVKIQWSASQNTPGFASRGFVADQSSDFTYPRHF